MPRKGTHKHKKHEPTLRAKEWIFTINFKGRETLTEEDCLPKIRAPIRYRIYQFEAGETGTAHIQGYMQCTRDVSRRTICKWPGYERAWTEPAQGGLDANQRYCSKEEGRQGGPFEEGDPEREPGKRSDLLRLKNAIDDGATELALYDIHFSSTVRYFRGLQRYRLARVPPRREAPQVTVYWGSPGCGKSHRAFTICQGRGWSYYVKNNTKWWDGYEGQKAIIFSEFDPAAVPYRYLLEILDKWQTKVEVKGDSVQINSPAIFICSNTHPKDWYCHEDYAPLERRIHKIVHFKTIYGNAELQKPHECENSEDSLDEGEVNPVPIEGIEGSASEPAGEDEYTSTPEEWDDEEELKHLAEDEVISPVRSPHLSPSERSEDEELVMFDEIPENIREQIREGKKDASPELEK